MTMLKSGWVIVGSTPSNDGTTATKGAGCLIVLDSNGQLATVWSGRTSTARGATWRSSTTARSATLFVSMAGFGVPAPARARSGDRLPVVVNKATVLRLDLAIPGGKPPR